MSRITVVRANKTVAPKGYTVVELAYKTDEGKTKGMKLFGFGTQKANSEVAAAAQPGDVLEAVFQQNDKGYWEFASLRSTGEKAAVATGSEPEVGSGKLGSVSSPAKGNWETSDERAARQVYIIRQSSLSTAVAFYDVNKVKPSVEDVVTTAKQFADFVLKGTTVTVSGDVA